MIRIQNEILEFDIKTSSEDEFLKLMYLPTEKMGLIQANSPYIPIKNFMDGFKLVTEMVKDYGITSLVFDKRNLTNFHQPSMEWYFVHWKPEVKALGLTSHYKILPNEEWFKKCVEAGRSQISESYPTDLLEGITVQYVDTINEAVQHRKSLSKM